MALVIDASIRTVGDALHNSLAKSINGLYRAELIRQLDPGRDAAYVEASTLDDQAGYNHHRPCQYGGDMPPIDCEQLYYNRQDRRASKLISHTRNQVFGLAQTDSVEVDRVLGGSLSMVRRS